MLAADGAEYSILLLPLREGGGGRGLPQLKPADDRKAAQNPSPFSPPARGGGE